MNRLVINTATDELFIALQKGEDSFSHSINSVMHHNETMLTEIDKLLKANNLSIRDIDELGVVIGPGSFTGIRVGIATVKAFRDALKIKAKGINCLDYLFALSNKKQNTNVVAMAGSRDSYFVAASIHDVVYKFERNLTLKELNEVAKDSAVGMFKQDDNVKSFKVEQDAKILLDCLDKSEDELLVPVYYQLSQAENEKNKRVELVIRGATKEDLADVAQIEKDSILTNPISAEQLEKSYSSDMNKIFVATIENEIVGFVLIQKTDEVNIDSIAVKLDFRNRGVATKLIETAKNFAKDNDIDVVSLEVGYKNISAFLLYEKLGFEIRRIRKKYYANGDDAVEMILKI